LYKKKRIIFLSEFGEIYNGKRFISLEFVSVNLKGQCPTRDECHAAWFTVPGLRLLQNTEIT